MSDKGIIDLTIQVVNARKEIEQTTKMLEFAKSLHQDLKTANDTRIELIQEENRKIDSGYAEKKREIEEAQKQIETVVYEAKAKLLKRIVLCNLKNLLPQLTVVVPEDIASLIYKGVFVSIYDVITHGSKPVNNIEYKICVQEAKQQDEKHSYSLQKLLEVAWQPTYQEIHRSYWSRDDIVFFSRDFPSEETAKAYAERNRVRLTQDLIAGIRQVETTISEADGDINKVFEFRLITDTGITTSDRDRDNYKIISADKHTLTLAPFLTNYARTVEKIEPYHITVTQKENVLTFAGHRSTGDARAIKDTLNKYFTSSFKAIEEDTGQEILDRNNY